MFTRFLSYNRCRNTPWTEHDKFPKGVIRNRDKLIQRFGQEWSEKNENKVRIFGFTGGGTALFEIPEYEWDKYLDA